MNTPELQLYKRVVRPVLFRFPPELTHNATAWLLRRFLARKALRLFSPSYEVVDPRLHVRIAGLEFPSPVGLAAGFDKDCGFLHAMLALGFGYVVGGTVLLGPQAGNQRPRLQRFTKELSMLNSMGFPSAGAQAVQRNLGRLEHRKKPVVVSVAGLSLDEMIACHSTVEPLADAVELNISSPNTEGLRIFQQPDSFAELVEGINAHRTKPLFVKLPFYSDAKEQERVLGLVRAARQHGVDGVTASNTRPVAAPMLAAGRGGLSGKALFQDTLRIVKEVRGEASERMAVHGVGGVFTAEDAYRVLQAGADTVQLFTALVYEGPGVARRINRGLLRLLERDGTSSVEHLTRSNTAEPAPTRASIEGSG